MNRYASITSPGGDDILVRSDSAVDVEVDEDPVTVTTAGNFHGARVTADNTTTPAFPEISITGDNDFSESGHRWIPQATLSPSYDDDGNLTNDGRWIYAWDAMNRLVGMTPTAAALTAGVPNQTLAFAYDHLGRRIAKKVTTAGQTTTIKDVRYLYEGWNVVVQFTADTSNDLTPDATFLWALDLSGSFHGAGGVGGLHSVNLLSQSESAKLCLACYDANGNIIAWTDATGRVLQSQDYDPFGNRVIRERLAITPEESERLEYGFSTKPLDAETGLIYYIFRYYGPRDGRWLSEDPIGVLGGLNLYGFVENRPISATDVNGLWVHENGIIGPSEAYNRVAKKESLWARDLSKIQKLLRGHPSPAMRRDLQGQYRLEVMKMIAKHHDHNVVNGADNQFGNANKWVFTCKYGWIDIAHFFNTARLAYLLGSSQKAYDASIGMEALQNTVKGLDAEFREPYLDQGAIYLLFPSQIATGESAYTLEDLPSNYNGAVFGEFMYDNDNADAFAAASIAALFRRFLFEAGSVETRNDFYVMGILRADAAGYHSGDYYKLGQAFSYEAAIGMQRVNGIAYECLCEGNIPKQAEWRFR